MKALVTGGCGFIGSHLVERLLDEGHKVIVIDDLSEGKLEYLPTDNPNLEFHQKSILDDIGHLFKDVEAVFHLAALPRPLLSIEEPKPAHEVNVTGTLNILIHCRDHKVGRLVYASSASLYGEQPVYPSPEEATPNPMSPYALHKYIMELYAKLFETLYGLQANGLRFFNVYGDRMNPNGFYASLIPKFIKIIKSGERPTIFGTGEQARDFVYVDDVVEALILASKSKHYGLAFNIGWGKNYSVNEVFKTIRRLLKIDVEPLYGPAVIEPTQTLADSQRARGLLGWEPKVSLEEGIRRLI